MWLPRGNEEMETRVRNPNKYLRGTRPCPAAGRRGDGDAPIAQAHDPSTPPTLVQLMRRVPKPDTCRLWATAQKAISANLWL